MLWTGKNDLEKYEQLKFLNVSWLYSVIISFFRGYHSEAMDLKSVLDIKKRLPIKFSCKYSRF